MIDANPVVGSSDCAVEKLVFTDGSILTIVGILPHPVHHV